MAWKFPAISWSHHPEILPTVIKFCRIHRLHAFISIERNVDALKSCKVSISSFIFTSITTYRLSLVLLGNHHHGRNHSPHRCLILLELARDPCVHRAHCELAWLSIRSLLDRSRLPSLLGSLPPPGQIPRVHGARGDGRQDLSPEIQCSGQGHHCRREREGNSQLPLPFDHRRGGHRTHRR